MAQCDWLLPRHDHLLTPDNDMVECLFRENHGGQHLSKLPDGQFILWEPEGQCEDCPVGECECFDWVEISEEEATRRMVNQ